MGYAMYNLALSLLLLLIIWLALGNLREVAMIARIVVLLWAVFISVAVLFFPKVYFVLTGAKATLRRTTENSRNGTQSLRGASTSSNGEDAYLLEKKLAHVKKEIEMLRKELTKHDAEAVKTIKEKMRKAEKDLATTMASTTNSASGVGPLPTNSDSQGGA